MVTLLLMSMLALAFEVGVAVDRHDPSFQTFSEPPPTEWSKTYGGTNDDDASSVVQTSDGGYAMAGWTLSYGAGGSDMWLVKTDASGNMQWSRTYGGTADDYANVLVQTSDGGYALAGYTTSYGAGGADFWLIKTDSAGNLQWSKTYGGAYTDIANALIQTADGGYALAGLTAHYPNADFLLVKTDSSGNAQWTRTYGGANYEHAYALVRTVDGGYALAGYTASYGAGADDFWLVKTDANGYAQWSKTYGGTWYDDACALVQTTDGGYAIAGNTVASVNSPTEFLLVKTDSAGNTQWTQTYGGAFDNNAFALVQTLDGGYALAGHTWMGPPLNTWDFWLVKTDAVGNAQWNKNYGGVDTDIAYALAQTNDGGYALAGYTKSFGTGNSDFWLVKVGTTGPGNNAPYTPSNPSPSNHASGVPISQVLSWSGGDPDPGDMVTYDVNFGLTSSPPLVSSGQSATTYNPGALSHATTYYWRIVATDNHGASTSGPIWDFVTAQATITDQQKQQYLLTMVNNHRGMLPPELVLGVIRTEGGAGAFHVDGWNYNSFYRQIDGQWAQPTNGDGIMQVSAIGNPVYHERSGSYTNDQAGYDHAINDGSDYLLNLYYSYGSYVQTVLHYNTGPSSLWIYMGDKWPYDGIYTDYDAWGDKLYLSHVAEQLTNFVPNIYGLQNPNLVNILNKGHSILNTYLYSKGIKTGQSVDYYRPYQKQLDADLLNMELRARAGETNMRVSVFACPVNVTISDDYGRIISEVEEQIPGASFEYFNATDTRVFFLPLNLTYHVQINATDYGNITISQITPLESIYEMACSSVAFNLTSETEADFDLLPYDANYTLEVDEDGDGEFDYELTPEIEITTTEYDVGVTEIVPSKTVVGQGYSLPVNMTVVNYGAHTEMFNVTLYANDTFIELQTITLINGTSTTITFIWNTTGFAKGNYIIWAYAEPVPGETNTADNTFVGGWVVVTSHGWELDFTAPTRYPIVDFAVYNGSLYAAADNKLYVYNGSWNALNAPTFVTSLEPYEDKLVVGGQGGLHYYDGTSFGLIFSVPTYIKALEVYDNRLYAGTMLDKPPTLYYCNGSCENPSNWYVDTDFTAILNFSGPFGSIDSFAVYDNVMYVGSGGTLYSLNGTSWSIAASYTDVYAFLDMQV